LNRHRRVFAVADFDFWKADLMKIVLDSAIKDLVSRAHASPRLRMNLNLHDEPSELTGRFLNAGLPGTYVRPHRHRPDKWELVSVIQGASIS
jgi:cupin fold WbuC family metalloprotein